jgi:hypothetical protein
MSKLSGIDASACSVVENNKNQETTKHANKQRIRSIGELVTDVFELDARQQQQPLDFVALVGHIDHLAINVGRHIYNNIMYLCTRGMFYRRIHVRG